MQSLFQAANTMIGFEPNGAELDQGDVSTILGTSGLSVIAVSERQLYAELTSMLMEEYDDLNIINLNNTSLSPLYVINTAKQYKDGVALVVPSLVDTPNTPEIIVELSKHAHENHVPIILIILTYLKP